MDKRFWFGALGGVLPTLAQVAPTYGANWETPLPAFGWYFALLLWAIVGGSIALTNTSPEKREAIFAGIAAPGVVLSLVAGVADSNMRRKTAELSPLSISLVILAGALVSPAIAQENAGPWSAVVFSPKVSGGVTAAVTIPVTAVVKTGDKTETVPVGQITTLNGPSTFFVPRGTTQVLVSGQPVTLSGEVTKATLDVKTKPSFTGDFLWALGAPRKFSVEGIAVLKDTPGAPK